MPQHYLDASPTTQMRCQLFGQIDRAMLAASAAERHHQALEPAALIVGHAGIHQRHGAGEELADALLPVEILDHRCVLSGERPELFFTPGIGETAAVEDEA